MIDGVRHGSDTGKERSMSVKVYGCNHIAIEVDDVEKAVAFYQDVFNLERLKEGEGNAFFKLGEHQFLAMFEVKEVKPDRARHFGIMVRDETQLAEVREKLTKKYGIKLIPPFGYPELVDFNAFAISPAVREVFGTNKDF